jgi:superfamily II DNA or RNA helicase
MKTLRWYQVEAKKQLSAGWKKHQRQILALTTGSGKTYTFVDMAISAAKRGHTVLVLTHRTELFSQTYGSFGAMSSEPKVIGPDSKDPGEYTGIFVAMVETLARRKHLIAALKPNVKLIIIDEAHFGNFNKIIEEFPDAFILAVTATPVGKHFYEYYTNIVQTIDTPDLINEGFLVPYKAYQMADDFSDLKKGANGDYSHKSQYDHFNKDKLYNGVIDEWKRRCKGKKTIIFNCNIKHSDETAQAFRDAGIKSYSVTSKTTKADRDRYMDEFENGDCMVLNNTSILTAGYDHPPIECVILNRATDSLTLFLQMIGRGSRLYSGKTHFICLDFGGNHSRHGMWSQPRKWELKPQKKKKKGEAVVKDCPKCEALVYGSARICEFCGYEFPIAIKSLKDGVMEEYFEKDVPTKPPAECTTEEVALLVRLNMMPANKAASLIKRRGKSELVIFARHMGYSMGWVHNKMKYGYRKPDTTGLS